MIRARLVESKPGCFDGLDYRVIDELHHHEFVELLESCNIVLVDGTLVVYLRQKGALSLVQVFVKRIMPVGRLNQCILHPTEVRTEVEQLANIFAAT